MVEREPVWTDSDREQSQGLVLFRALRHTCGVDLRVGLDPDVEWDVDNKTRCYACTSEQIVRRDDAELHRDDRHVPGRPQFSDGRLYTVRPYRPDDTLT